MGKFPQELIEKSSIIDRVDYVRVCSLVGRHWVERSRWRMWGSRYCWFIDRRQLDSWHTRLLTTGSVFVERTHTLNLNSTSVRAWGEYFHDAGAVLPQLRSPIIANARSPLHSDVETLKRNSGNTLVSLSLNRVSTHAREFSLIFPFFPNLDNLLIVGLHPSPPPPGNTRTYPRAQGELTLVNDETHDKRVPFCGCRSSPKHFISTIPWKLGRYTRSFVDAHVKLRVWVGTDLPKLPRASNHLLHPRRIGNATRLRGPSTVFYYVRPEALGNLVHLHLDDT